MDDLNPQTPERRLADVLLGMRGKGTDWGEPYQSGDNPWSKKTANTFLLCCMLEYRIRANVAWANGERLVKTILDDPVDVWRAITSVSESEWKSKYGEYKLHKFPMAHLRLWRTGTRVCNGYEGDARRIWEGKEPAAALEALRGVGAGDQISRMIVGALKDCGQIKGLASDVKGDVYVRRVLGRAMLGAPTDAQTAVKLARRLHPADPWRLDAALWVVGNTVCKTTPACSKCDLSPHCAYALRKPVKTVGAVTPAVTRKSGKEDQYWKLELADGRVVGKGNRKYTDAEYDGQALIAAGYPVVLVWFAGRAQKEEGKRWPVAKARLHRVSSMKEAGEKLAVEFGLVEVK